MDDLPHDATAWEESDGGWLLRCGTCWRSWSGLTADEAHRILLEHAPDVESWVTPDGHPGFRTRR